MVARVSFVAAVAWDACNASYKVSGQLFFAPNVNRSQAEIGAPHTAFARIFRLRFNNETGLYR